MKSMLNNMDEQLKPLENGQKDENRNISEDQALLRIEEQIKGSAYKEPRHNPQFKERLKSIILEKRRTKKIWKKK